MSDSTARIDAIQKNLSQTLLTLNSTASGVIGIKTDRNMRNMLRVGEKLRNAVWELPLANAAAQVYQDLASTREWTVSGKEKPVTRTVEALNNATTWDYTTGMVDVGFEQFLRRRSLDHILVGRKAAATHYIEDPSKFQIEYLDPVHLWFNSQKLRVNGRGMVPPVKPKDKIWSYGYLNSEPIYTWEEVAISHAIPVGMNGFVPPFLLAYPMAVMAYLLQEHDEAKLNGRKLRDIILVDKGIYEPVMTALQALLGLWTGEDPTRTGIPVVEVSQSLEGNLQDRIATLGLSNLPESFDRDGFYHYFANLLAGTFGLALRQFWQDDSNTNRALEEVQEARQQLKGPLAFVRSEERWINASSIVTVFSTGPRPTRFAFVEETDTSSLKDKAQALSYFGDALMKIAKAVGARLKPEFLIRKAQQLDLLPVDVPIDEMLMKAEEVIATLDSQQTQPAIDTNTDPALTQDVSISPDRRTNQPNELTQIKAKIDAYNNRKKDPDLDYDEIRMDSKMRIIDRRIPVYRAAKTSLEEKVIASDEISRYDAEDAEEIVDETQDNGHLESLFLAGLSYRE